jgi:hypothetical protein
MTPTGNLTRDMDRQIDSSVTRRRRRDMHQKYADVIDRFAEVEYFSSLGATTPKVEAAVG